MRRSLCPNASCNAGFIRNAAQQKARQKDTGEGKPDGPTEPEVTGAAPRRTGRRDHRDRTDCKIIHIS